MRFDGALDSQPSLHRFKQVYRSIMTEHLISPESQPALLHHALEGIARDFFFESIREVAKNLDTAFALLDSQFDSEHRRAQARAFLESQSLAAIRTEFQCSNSRALEHAVQRINNVTPQCGSAMNDDVHRSHWLANIVRQEEWAQPVLTARLTQALGYSQFHTMLVSALTQLSLSRSTEASSEEMAYGSHFGAAYGMPRGRSHSIRSRGRRLYHGAISSSRQQYGRKRRTAAELRELKNRTTCLRCGQKGHWRAECSTPVSSLADAVRARIKSSGDNDSAVRSALTALVLEEDAYTE